MKTWFAKKEEAERKWWLVDGQDQVLGRLSTQLANLLRGKHKPTFTPHTDNGDFVVVINADKIHLTGDKWRAKKYYRHSRHFGSLKEKTAAQMKAETPEKILIEAVRGMLPTNRLSRQLIKKLKVYSGPVHHHEAQKPLVWSSSSSSGGKQGT